MVQVIAIALQILTHPLALFGAAAGAAGVLIGKAAQAAANLGGHTWATLSSSSNYGRIPVPRTPGLGKTATVDELLKTGAIPGQQGVILDQKYVSYSDLWELTRRTGLEYALTKENGSFVLRSGAANTVPIPNGIRPIAHTHPFDNVGIPEPLPSNPDINTLNQLWSLNPNGRRPRSTIIWGPNPGNTTQFGATGTQRLPP